MHASVITGLGAKCMSATHCAPACAWHVKRLFSRQHGSWMRQNISWLCMPSTSSRMSVGEFTVRQCQPRPTR